MDKNIPINELTNFLFEPHLCCSSLISFMPQHLLPFSPPPSLVSLWVRLILESYKNLKYWHPIWDKDIVWDPQTRSFSEGGNSSRDVSHKQVIIQYVLKRGKKKKGHAIQETPIALHELTWTFSSNQYLRNRFLLSWNATQFQWHSWTYLGNILVLQAIEY